jgi:hypothetical protein
MGPSNHRPRIEENDAAQKLDIASRGNEPMNNASESGGPSKRVMVLVMAFALASVVSLCFAQTSSAPSDQYSFGSAPQQYEGPRQPPPGEPCPVASPNWWLGFDTNNGNCVYQRPCPNGGTEPVCPNSGATSVPPSGAYPPVGGAPAPQPGPAANNPPANSNPPQPVQPANNNPPPCNLVPITPAQRAMLKQRLKDIDNCGTLFKAYMNPQKDSLVAMMRSYTKYCQNMYPSGSQQMEKCFKQKVDPLRAKSEKLIDATFTYGSGLDAMKSVINAILKVGSYRPCTEDATLLEKLDCPQFPTVL